MIKYYALGGFGAAVFIVVVTLSYGSYKYHKGFDQCVLENEAKTAAELNNSSKDRQKNDKIANSVKTPDLDDFGRKRSWLRDKTEY